MFDLMSQNALKMEVHGISYQLVASSPPVLENTFHRVG